MWDDLEEEGKMAARALMWDDLEEEGKMVAAEESATPTPSSVLRWRLLRQAFLTPRPTQLTSSSCSPTTSDFSDCLSQGEMKRISRKPTGGFNLVPHHIIETTEEYAQATMCTLSPSGRKDVLIEYNLSLGRTVSLMLLQRRQNHVDRRDFQICKEYEIDNTGVVCLWPSEEVLTYFCISNDNMFRNKRVLELGSGYGLAGLSIAACTDAAEVVISDGNPQVVEYIQKNISANAGSFEDTKVTSLLLRWGEDEVWHLGHSFDFILAADCTFFKEFHADLAHTLKTLLALCKDSQAIFFSPRRGTTLDLFLQAIISLGLHVKITENYNSHVWDLHTKFMEQGNCSYAWPNYDEEHCYPLLITISS